MNVETVMTRKVFTVRMDDTIGTIREILKTVPFHHLLVVEGRKLVGILSDRDILKVISPFLETLSETDRDITLLNRKVHQIMTRKPVTAKKNTSVEDAARLLLDNKISCLPVTTSEREILGVVTLKDILKFYVKGEEETTK